MQHTTSHTAAVQFPSHYQLIISGTNCLNVFNPFRILVSIAASHLNLHWTCHLNNKTYALTSDLHWYQCLHLYALYRLLDSRTLQKQNVFITFYVVRWMCGIKLQNRIPSKGLRKSLRLDDIISVLRKTDCDGMVICCEKKTMIGWRNVWSIKWRMPCKELVQRKLLERL